jgi:hypothetical protein
MTVHTLVNGILQAFDLPEYWREPDLEALFAEINARALANSENEIADPNTLMEDCRGAEGARLWVKDGRGGWLLRDVRKCAGGGTIAEVFPHQYGQPRYIYESPYRAKGRDGHKPEWTTEPRLLQETKEAWK